jgi:ketosteroid isomerase-like protein
MVGDVPGDWQPPLLEHLTLENPWPLAGALAAVAVAVFLVMGRRGNRRGQMFALIPLLPAVGVIVVAQVIETEREAMAAGTRAAIAAVTEPFNEAALSGDFTDAAQLVVGDYNLQREGMLTLARLTLQKTPITGTWVTRLDAREVTPNTGQVALVVLAQIKDAGAVKMRWLLDWRRGEDGRWRMSRATLETVNDQAAQGSQLPR